MYVRWMISEKLTMWDLLLGGRNSNYPSLLSDSLKFGFENVFNNWNFAVWLLVDIQYIFFNEWMNDYWKNKLEKSGRWSGVGAILFFLSPRGDLPELCTVGFMELRRPGWKAQAPYRYPEAHQAATVPSSLLWASNYLHA